MDPEKEKASVAQNVAGEHHKVIGGNTFYGDAHIHIQLTSCNNYFKGF